MKLDEERLNLYNDKNCNDRTRILSTTIYDNQIITNALIKFKQKYFQSSVSGLPLNEFSIEHMCFRVYKVYGSIMRDIYHAVFFNTYDNISASYSYYEDLNGVDLFLNNIPIYAYTDTSSAIEFAKEKNQYRHKNLPFGIILQKTIYEKKLTGFYFVKDKTINRIVEEVKKIGENSLDHFILINENKN